MTKLKLLSSSTIPYAIIIIIILCVLYLIYRYYQTSHLYESFRNTQTPTALSVYFQNNVDSDQLMTNKYNFNAVVNPMEQLNNETSLPVNIWNGIWRNEDQNINCQIIQRNENLIISLSNYGFDRLNITGRDDNGCTNNIFLGHAKLNNTRDFFILTEIKCNTYINDNLTFEVNKFTGRINNSEITLYSEGKAQTTILTLFSSFTNDSKDFKNYKFSTNYINRNDPYASASGTIPDSNFVYEENFCENPEKYQPCIDKAHGLVEAGYGESPYNACGTKGNDGLCQDWPNNSGICTIANVNGFARCKKITQVYDYMNFMPSLEISKMTGNNLAICNYLNYFSDSKCNSCILAYVENVGNVQTLNYEFNNVLKDQNSLTVQYDAINTVINKIFLNKYRELILNNIENNESERVSSFINCLEDNKDSNIFSDLMKTCTEDIKNNITNYKEIQGNHRLAPAIWEIHNTLSNSCSFTLKTHRNYKVQPKYVECNNNGSTSLSLYKGGQNQKMVFENAIIIKEVDDNYKSPFIAFTANIRAYNSLYLLPSPDNGAFNNNSNKVRLAPKPLPNGKWLVIGFSLSNFNDLNKQIEESLRKAYT